MLPFNYFAVICYVLSAKEYLVVIIFLEPETFENSDKSISFTDLFLRLDVRLNVTYFLCYNSTINFFATSHLHINQSMQLGFQVKKPYRSTPFAENRQVRIIFFFVKQRDTVME